MINIKRDELLLLIIIVVLLIFCAAVVSKLLKTPPSELFSKYVLEPIPESVRKIKVDRPKKIWGYLYTFRFNINRQDLALIINSQPFTKVFNVKYREGRLVWNCDLTNSISIPVYADRPLQFEPLWFRLKWWKNSEAYAFVKEEDGREDIRVLIYNEKKKQAYFITFSPSR